MTLRIATYLLALCVGALAFVMASDAQNNPDGVVTKVVDPSEEKYEWTLERMLMATPMPMTQEERQFFSTHPTLDGVRAWKVEEFRKYIGSALGKHHAAEESLRWRELVAMLTKQLAAVKPVLGIQQQAQGARPATPEIDGKSIADIEAALSGPAAERVFSQMKILRQEIADQASRVEALRKEAQSKGLGDKFEGALSEVE